MDCSEETPMPLQCNMIKCFTLVKLRMIATLFHRAMALPLERTKLLACVHLVELY
jgi:hypothetical protein